MLRIVTHSHPALRHESYPVTQIDERLRNSVRAMFDLMYEARGIGLAANQVAIPRQFFVLNLASDPEMKEQERVFINPVIVKRNGLIEEEEGCLSFPGVYAKVKRAKRIRVKAYDLQGNEVTVDADELLGRAIQHETDHLHGKLFVDYLEDAVRAANAAKIRDIEAAYRESQARGETPDDDALRAALAAWPTLGPEAGGEPAAHAAAAEFDTPPPSL